MKTAEQWNEEYKLICFNDPAVHGQILPNPQNIEFIRRVMKESADSARREALGLLERKPNPENMNKPRHHVLKCWPEYFDAIGSRVKTFEARMNDRDFQSGDSLELREWRPETEDYTGRWIWCRVSYVMHGGQFGIHPGWCVMGIQLPANHIWPIACADSTLHTKG